MQVGKAIEKVAPVIHALNSLPSGSSIDQTETTSKHTHVQLGTPAPTPIRRKHRPTKAAPKARPGHGASAYERRYSPRQRGFRPVPKLSLVLNKHIPDVIGYDKWYVPRPTQLSWLLRSNDEVL